MQGIPAAVGSPWSSLTSGSLSVWGVRPTQDFLRDPDEKTKGTLVLYSCSEADLTRHSRERISASKESKSQLWGPDSYPWAVIICV